MRAEPLIGACVGPEHAGALAGEGGLDFLEVNVQGFLCPLSSEAEFAPKVEEARRSAVPLRAANCFLPGGIKSAGPGADAGAVLAYAKTAFARAAACGIGVIVFGSGGSRKLPEGMAAGEALADFVVLLRSLGGLAEAAGVTLVLEPLNRTDCNFIQTVEEGAAVVRSVNHPSVRLLVDLYHMARNGERWSDLEGVAELTAHVHVAEGARRTPPGVEGDRFEEAFGILKARGYGGAISVEANWSDLVGEARRAAEVLRQQWADA